MTNPDKGKILYNLPWLGILILIILSLAFLLPVLPNDFWWYLRLGKDIVANTSVPSVDTYSSTIYGQPVSYPMWLSAVILYGLHQIGDLSLVVLARGLMVAVFYTSLWIICVKKGLSGWLATFLTLLCALIGANNWAVRPQLFVYPLFGFSMLLLSSNFSINKSDSAQDIQLKDNEKENRFSTSIYLLIPIAIFWANLHGSVIILFLLVIPYFLFYKRTKKFFLILLLIFISTLLNPRGIMLWIDTFQILQASGNQFSQEWKPPVNSGWQMNLFFLWFLALIPLATFSKNKLKLYEWVWLLGFGWMALSGTRYVIWFLAIILIFTGWFIQGLLKSSSFEMRFGFIKINIGLFFILVLLPVSLLPGIRENWWDESPAVLSSNTPVNAVEWLKQNPGLPDPLFNDYLFGSYLIFALPEKPVWIDTRFHNYPKDHWEDYLSISNSEAGWSDKLLNAKIGTLMMDLTGQINLIYDLENSSKYCERYRDDIAVIFSMCK
ncbi:MAG: hypothetical protein Q7U53_12660 [Anaerolineaceae bacterium]|nr:hypothetical protein [Anaerolineaceae bacterium]